MELIQRPGVAVLGSEDSVAGEEGAATEGVFSADVKSIPENSHSFVFAAILNYTLAYTIFIHYKIYHTFNRLRSFWSLSLCHHVISPIFSMLRNTVEHTT